MKRWLIEQPVSAARGKVVVLVSHRDTIWRLAKTLLESKSATAHFYKTRRSHGGIASDGKISCKFVNRCPRKPCTNDQQSRHTQSQNIAEERERVREGPKRVLHAHDRAVGARALEIAKLSCTQRPVSTKKNKPLLPLRTRIVVSCANLFDRGHASSPPHS